MPLFAGTRPLKRWRYVGVYCEQLMACAAQVHVGPARQSFWAIFTRTDDCMRERTHMLGHRRAVELTPGRLRVCDEGVTLDLALEEGVGVQTVCRHGRGQVWTRKQAGVAARGTLLIDGEDLRAVEALAVIDDTAGYHARHTEWRWAAGVGTSPDGVPLAFNLVAGVNDPVSGSERAIWIDGKPHEAAPVRFSDDLRSIVSADGSELRFSPEAERCRRDSLLLVSSDYQAHFGVFSGTLPGGIELARGLGVAEHHRARW